MTAEKVPFDRKDAAHRRCPICGKPSTAAVAPFCSKRCADVDLHRWLGGVYVVPDDEPGQPDLPDELNDAPSAPRASPDLKRPPGKRR